MDNAIIFDWFSNISGSINEPKVISESINYLPNISSICKKWLFYNLSFLNAYIKGIKLIYNFILLSNSLSKSEF